jgi:DNA-binding NtrC family response regulator
MGSPGAVLVLDEDINLRVSLAQILKQAGYVVSTACSPNEARKLLQAHPYGLVFLDIGLMAGVEMDLVTEFVHSYPHTPLLVLSPYLNSGDNFPEHPHPTVHFLVKPIDPATILEVIRSIIIGENRPS